MICCLQNKPVTYSPLLTKHRPRCSKMNNYTIHTYYTITLCRQKLSLTVLPFQSESTIPDQIHLFCFVQNCHLVYLIVLVPQQMLKWSKRVSLRPVSFTNYPTLHHPLLSTFLFFSFFFCTCLQILHITKYYIIPRIQNQIHTKFQLHNQTHIIHSRICTKYCSMFHTFISD